MSKLLKFSVAAAAFAALSGYAQAQETPATPPAPPVELHLPPYDCTLTEAVLCKAGATCTPASTLGELPLPARVLLHFEQQVLAGVSADGLPHVSQIGTLARSSDMIIAQGVDGGTGWMVHSTNNDDEVTFVAASDDFIINAFGTCKPLGLPQ